MNMILVLWQVALQPFYHGCDDANCRCYKTETYLLRDVRTCFDDHTLVINTAFENICSS